MKATDLRIGNLVNDEDGTPMYIAGIWPVVSNKHNFIDSAGNTGDVNILSEIKLTPAILEKCGFKTAINNRDSGYKQMGVIVNGHDFMFTIECNHQPEFYFDMVGTEINHLHQLQNLYYALCGEELQIKDL